MGEVTVPAGALWGAQTQRAIENFPISGIPVAAGVVRALGAIKQAAARANADLGVLELEVANAVATAAADVAAGAHAGQFPVDVFQTGSGTSTNMNVNEVIATLASAMLGAAVHPNDHVNASHSSNDVFPSALRIAAATAVEHDLVPALEHLAATLRDARDRFAHVVKAGRTHLMDAVPVTLGQEFGGYATAVANGVERISACLDRLHELPLGGTAVGTGLNAPAGFATQAIAHLADATGLALVEARDHFEAQSMQDPLVEASGACRVVALGLNKIALDLRLMGSGPTAGLGEIHLPDLQPGSSIMPGKVNPVIPEAVHQVVAQVIGNDTAITFAASMGTFELNTMLPVMGRNLLESVQLLANVSRLLADRCIAGIEADEEACLRHALSSPSLATVLNPLIGYEAAAEVVHQAVREHRTILDIVVARGLLSPEQAARALDVHAMAHPHNDGERGAHPREVHPHDAHGGDS